MAQPELYFDILDTYDLRIFRLLDLSEWNDFENITAYVEITAPARKESKTYELEKNKINIFNSNSIGITCATDFDGLVDLPDGIYKIKIYVCDEDEVISYEACYLRTTKAMLRLDKILIGLDVSCCDLKRSNLERYFKIELLIKSAHAHVRDGNIIKGSRDFNMALDLLDEFENCIDKDCC